MLLFNRYDYNPHTDLIGKGGSSKVYKVLDKKFNRWLALKMYKATEEADRYTSVLEIEKVIALNHPNISPYVDIDAIEKEDSFGETERIQVCVMEIAEGGNIDKYFQANPDFGILKKLLLDVIYGLQYLHENGIVHRDIKPSNILVKKTTDGPIAIIADFGISREQDSFSNSSSSGLVVSVPYMAPEQLNPQKYGIDETISANVDIWALGIAVYEIITGDVLFKLHERDSAEQIMNNIISGELPDKANQLPPPFAEFVRQCLVKDAKKRAKAPEELISFLNIEKEPLPDIAENAENSEKKENTEISINEVTAIEAAAIPVSADVPNQVEEKPGIETDNLGDTQVFVIPSIKEVSITQSEIAEIAEMDTAVVPRKLIDETLATIESNNPQVNEDVKAPENIDYTRFFEVPIKLPESDISNVSVETSADLEEALVNDNQAIEEIAVDAVTEISDIENDVIFTNEGQEINTSPEPDEDIQKETKTVTVEELEQITEEPVTVERKEENINLEIHSPIPVEIRMSEEPPAPSVEKPVLPVTTEIVVDSTVTAVVARPKERPILLFNRYEYYPSTHLIGKGGFSRVYQAFDKKLSRWIALKIYKTGEFSERYSPIAEIQRVINLDHPNICRYLDIDEIEKENQFGEYEKIQVCVMELLDSGNFSEYYKKTKDLVVLKKLLQDVLNGISYLHKNGIIHRDIKPANILIKSGIDGPVAKITDFGISKKSDSENNSSSALVVSIPYMAPEQLNVKKYGVNEKISFNLDLWSLGVTVYEVITGKVLFKNNDQDNSEQIMANIMLPDLPAKINELPQPFRSIVSHCVIKNANERAQKAEELLVLLNTSKHSEGFKEEDEDRPIPVALVLTVAAEKKVEQETSFFEKKSNAANGQPAISDTTKRRKNFLVDDEPLKKHPKDKLQSQFPIKTVSGVAVIILVIMATIFFFKSLNSNRNNTTEQNTTDLPAQEPSEPKTDFTPAKNDSVSTNLNPVVKDKSVEPTDTDSKNGKENAIENVTVIPEKKKESKSKIETKKKTSEENADRVEDVNKKYSVNFKTSESCILKINSTDMGEISGVIKIALLSGTYTVRAINTKNSSSVFVKTIVVNAKNSGQLISISF